MSLRLGCLAALFAFGCAAAGQTETNEPTTAREKQLREARKHREVDDQPVANPAGWRYKGDRKSCFFVVGRTCFKTENAACQAARCKSPKKCKPDGAAPSVVACK